MTPPQPCARNVLREATRPAHERLHLLPDFAALAQGRLSRAGYVALLGRLLGFHAPMEQVVAAALSGEQGDLAPDGWRRADLLRDDLAYFGVDAAGLDALVVTLQPGGRAAAIGCLYVLEGSTLGGRVLARKLDALLPAGGMAGRSFLNAGASPQHARWAAVCAGIDACGRSDVAVAAMVEAANATFRQFELWFSPAASTC